MTIKVTFPKKDTSNLKGNHRKENFCHSSYKVVNLDFKTIVDVRFYWNSRADGMSNVYCCLWIGGMGHHYSGSGKAGGCGYHKTSAALSDALDSAEITLSKAISGVGDEAICEAILAIAKPLTRSRKLGIVKTNA